MNICQPQKIEETLDKRTKNHWQKAEEGTTVQKSSVKPTYGIELRKPK